MRNLQYIRNVFSAIYLRLFVMDGVDESYQVLNVLVLELMKLERCHLLFSI